MLLTSSRICLFGAEDMRIILRKAAYAHQTMQRLMARYGGSYRIPPYAAATAAIGFQTLAVDLNVARQLSA